MMLLRGKGQGLEIGCSDRDVAAVCVELRARLSDRPDFYRGSRARAIFGAALPAAADLETLRDVLSEYEIVLDGVLGAPELEGAAAALGLAYLGAAPPSGPPAVRERAIRDEPILSESAKSLVADFAGARSDLAARRLRRERAVAVRAEQAVPVERPPAEPTTLYHVGTLRGGQSLHNVGNIVVVGDVNPGAELVASGDIVVFGALRGVAHAGAQGDESARVVALELVPTQLRIATLIAAGDPVLRGVPAHAIVKDARIAIVAHESAESIRREVVN